MMTEDRTGKSGKIYLYAEPGGVRKGDVIGHAVSESGLLIATHLSSSEQFAKHDMGLTSDRKHDRYKKFYPAGYELAWVDGGYEGLPDEVKKECERQLKEAKEKLRKQEDESRGMDIRLT